MKIGIVNDLKMAQEILKRVISSVSEYEVCWVAADGKEAIEKAATDKPDIILMDLIMLNIDGVEATKRIMEESPCAIIIVTSTVKGHGSQVYEAMGHGALDAVCTPILGTTGDLEGAKPLLEKIRRVGLMIDKVDVDLNSLPIEEITQTKTAEVERILAIGSSTGGPQALLEILSKLPKNFPAPIVIVQHVDADFAKGLAQWLDKSTPLQVQVAEEGTPLENGKAYIACTQDHLIYAKDDCLRYTRDPVDMVYRPSVDVFFKSLANNFNKVGVAVLLTGMGQDGAEGMLMLRKKGWFTIAQDEESSVVYGMPKAAAENGAAASILNPVIMPDTLMKHFPMTKKSPI